MTPERRLIQSISELWPMLSVSMTVQGAFTDACFPDQRQRAEAFLQNATEWIDIIGFEDPTPEMVADGQATLAGGLEALRAVGLVLYADLVPLPSPLEDASATRLTFLADVQALHAQERSTD